MPMVKGNKQTDMLNDSKCSDQYLSSDNATFVPDTALKSNRRNVLSNTVEKKVNKKLAKLKLFGSSRNIGVVFYEHKNSTNYLDNPFNVSNSFGLDNDITEHSGLDNLQFNNKYKLNAPAKNSFIKSPPMQIKALSLDSNKKYSTSKSKTHHFGFDKTIKLRSYSDTQNPLIDDHTGPIMEFLNENDAGRKRNKYKYQKGFPALSPILDNSEKKRERQVVDSLTNNEQTDGIKNKRWVRKISKYATCDENNAFNSSKSIMEPIVQTECKKKFEETQIKNFSFEQQLKKEGPVGRKISTGKMIKQSMSQGFSKFKQLSISGKNSGRKLEHYYSVIDNDEGDHETSHRIEPLETINDCTDIEDKEPISITLIRRCSSLPDILDSASVLDEEPDNLYLPRRMAICPDLAVPAMKQLRTYLVLNRLKQYCIV